MNWRKLIGIMLLVALIGGAGILLVWSASRHVYVVDVPITASPTDCGSSTSGPSTGGPSMRFAIIGDYGIAGQPEADVAAMIDRWGVDAIVTVGDDNYPNGEAETIDANIGQYYHAYIAPYQGTYGAGAATNRFFPALGNHDWRTDQAAPYLAYFTLPGNERYYTVRRGPVEFFILDSDEHEPDGITADSVQAQWLRAQLTASDAPWKLVILHHTPYTSSLQRNSNRTLQWPFAGWGATAVIAGHDHLYERLEEGGIFYMVNGAGGKDLYPFGPPEAGSLVRYNQDYGAQLINATTQCLNLTFFSRANELIDSVTLRQ
jgi:tartrate-resistant acid phosphatase type 5